MPMNQVLQETLKNRWQKRTQEQLASLFLAAGKSRLQIQVAFLFSRDIIQYGLKDGILGR